MQYSVVSYSKIAEHPEFRIDSECYTPFHLEVEKIIDAKGFGRIQDFAKSVINFGAYSLCNYIEFVEAGKPFLVTEDINNNIIDTGKLHYISDEVHEILHKSHCQKGQVLLTMAGAYLGQAAVFNEDFECSSNQAIAKVTLKENSINPYYLSTFLNCKYGQSQIERFRTGTGQPNLNLGLIKQIKVPDTTSQFQLEIEKIIAIALDQREKSVQIYDLAQKALLSVLGLANWQPKHRLSFVRNSSEVEKSARIDAEYFQPKYAEIVNAVKNYAGGWDCLGNLVTMKKSVEIGSKEYLDEGIPFVRVSNLSSFELTEEKYMSEKLYAELAKHQPQKGEILLSKDGSPGIAYHLREKPEKMIVSGGILRLKLKDKKINPDYLTLVLNSLLVQEQANRDMGGSIIYHWRPDQIKEVVIPILEEEKQNEIQQKVSGSFALRAKSKSLLEAAKRAVEMAIEEGEEKALAWLEAKVNIN